MTKELVFYDIEVYYRNAFVVFKNMEKETLAVFHNNFEGLEDFVKGKTLVGFNNYWYDDHVLHQMMDLKTPAQLKDFNDRIISGEKMRIKNYKFDSLDAFQEIDPSMPGLKKIQGNLGLKILESEVSFDIERELTDEEYEESLAYCSYDVDSTIEVFKLRTEKYFGPKSALIEQLGNPKAMRWNTTTISANLLTKKPLVKWSNIRVPDEILDTVPEEVVHMWSTKDKGSINLKEMENDIVFGFGGIHSSNNVKKKFDNVKLLDVQSFYSNTIINQKIIGDATSTYKEILEERVRIKKTHPDKQEGLKLVLNSVSGLLKSKYSLLFNPKASVTMCAIGQATLYDLAKRLAPTCRIVQLNTDGVAFETDSDDYIRVWKEWEKDYGYVLEDDEFKLFIQKDVNNYIGVEHSGKVKTKGGDVGRYGQEAVFKNNNARIVDIALVNKLVYGKDIIETIMDNLHDPKLFQYILKAGGTYAGTFDENDNKYQKINRVFAAKKEGLCLYKKRHDGGIVRFADAPLKMFLWNEHCDELEGFDEIVDINHYYQIITKKLERWL